MQTSISKAQSHHILYFTLRLLFRCYYAEQTFSDKIIKTRVLFTHFTQNHKVKPQGGARVKVRGSPKLVWFVLWRQWMLKKCYGNPFNSVWLTVSSTEPITWPPHVRAQTNSRKRSNLTSYWFVDADIWGCTDSSTLKQGTLKSGYQRQGFPWEEGDTTSFFKKQSLYPNIATHSSD